MNISEKSHRQEIVHLSEKTSQCPSIRRKASIKRFFVMIGFLPLFGAIQAMHWLGFLLDEIFFRGYRKITVRSPVFVVGVPRSGTTFLHHVLAKDEQFTTFRTWECLLAPSVTERKICLGLAQVDNRFGRPFDRLVKGLEKHILGSLEDIHAMALDAPEEDYFVFMPILACFILIVPFFYTEAIWRMAFFDRDMPEKRKQWIMAYYKRCLQKHLYVHGPNKRLLSKNPSFSSLVGNLNRTFPDCCFICCVRDPMKTMPSQLSSLKSGMKLFGVDPYGEVLRNRMLEVFLFYYNNLMSILSAVPPNRHVFLRIEALKSDLANTISRTYQQLAIPLDLNFIRHLHLEDTKVKSYVSKHVYSLEQFGLDEATLRKRFSRVYEEYELSAHRDWQGDKGFFVQEGGIHDGTSGSIGHARGF
jgi:omega-hydroxy-beta-dihydromenaquinone-9 sulfotransferase